MFALFDNQSDENLLQKYLLVKIAEALYAFKIKYVSEIIPVIEMFTIDALKNNVTGLINLRGETIPVYDLRGFLGKELSPIDTHQKFLILNVDDVRFAVIIDSVGDIVDIPEEKISKLLYNHTINFLSTFSIDNTTVIVTDAQAFLDYANQVDSVKKLNSGEMICAEAIEKIKNRTALVNQNNGYEITSDAFLNEKFIIFRLEKEIYAFNISYVKELKKINISTISKIPCVPDFVVGILNFRGDYISILDIKTFLNMKNTNTADKVDIAILKINKLKVAILIDEILDITNLPIAKLNPDEDSAESYIIGELVYKDNQLLNMLNVEKLFSSENVNIEVYE